MTKIVLTLPDFQLLCKTTESEILDAKEPLSIFFASCGKLYDNATDQRQKQIAEHLQSALMGFEKWVPMSESPPAIFKIHIVIGLIIFNCSPIVYVRVSLPQLSLHDVFGFFKYFRNRFSQNRRVSFL